MRYYRNTSSMVIQYSFISVYVAAQSNHFDSWIICTKIQARIGRSEFDIYVDRSVGWGALLVL
jgi:hypothetical protein